MCIKPKEEFFIWAQAKRLHKDSTLGLRSCSSVGWGTAEQQLGQINAKFLHITTLHLQLRIMASLDRQSSQLLQVIRSKGGVLHEKTLNLWIRYWLHANKIACGNQFSKSGHRNQKRVPAEVPDHADQREEAEREFEKTTMAFFVIRESDALSCALGISISIVIDVALCCMCLCHDVYALNLKYPEGLKYTFEAFQKIIIDIESKQMSRRVQNLSSKLQEYICFL
ncbi:Dichloromethane dehalogenase [Labeo rohita]|uniref:Dichloromethane dehalogenase n=1 Tax=Labeo rohita TaxID=84645 RepID=A0ABQ8LFA3_LABRO|nr:Dichloromethane dehalogenase [Labeo rohita]